MVTKNITILEAAKKMNVAEQIALVDNDNYFLVVTRPNFMFINSEDSDTAKYVFCTAQNGKGNDQMRYIYFTNDDDVETGDCGVICASDAIYKKVKDYFEQEQIVGIDVDKLGVFPIQPEYGSQYADAGIELFRLAK